MQRSVGTRVGAISHGDKDTVFLFGYGVYEGDHVPPPDAGGFNFSRPNPRIKLDSGKTVYGCECWWAPEDAVKAAIGARRVVDVDIDEARASAAANQPPDAVKE